MIKTEKIVEEATLIYWYNDENKNSFVAGLFIGDKMIEFKNDITLEEFNEFCERYNLKRTVDKIEKIER